MTARKCGVHQIAAVGVTRMNRELIAILGDSAEVVDMADVKFRVYALTEQIHCQCDDVDIAGSFSVAK